MSRIFLHVGQTKTGTTAIQNFLGKRRDALLPLGYLYPAEGCSHIHNHGPLVSAILGEQTSPRHVDAGEALKRSIAAHPDADVIISAERIFRYLQICGNRKIADPGLFAFLRETGLPVTVVAYIRPRAEWMNSRYVQGVKSFLIDVSFSDYVREEISQRNVRYANVPDLARPPEITMVFRPFDAELHRVGVVGDFLATVGFPDDQVAALGDEPRVNDSIGPVALAAALETLVRIKAQGVELTLPQRGALRARLLELIALEEPEPYFFGVDSEVAQLVQDHFASDSERFARTAWGKSWEEVFPPHAGRRSSNAFDARTSEPEAIERYGRLLEGLRSTSDAMFADAKLGQARPWERATPRSKAGKEPGRSPTSIIRALERKRAGSE